MTKRFAYILFSGLLIILFSGCASKGRIVLQNFDHAKIPGKNTEKQVILVGGYMHGMGSISRAKEAVNTTYLVFQIAAEYTLSKGYKYFAIYKPAMISNFDGSPINTMQDFQKKCTSSALGSLGSVFDDTGLNTYSCGIPIASTDYNEGYMEIALFNKKPTDILVWDANSVIEYLKKHNYYTKKDQIKTKVVQNVDSDRRIAYWIKYNRDKRN